ncbi:amidohydrolase [Halodesulfurarchaeum formicicum]|uniref:Amidohydrolase n=1 Tax=Halodesulfurarchaeum formicicum TaxID=1873524 RepID=A0A1J1A9J8_9EURY|nr:amidohydrolase [Halodesulfurarchaeum formicicum]APE94806.1 amidohydrolase [Halodesulfurarchaeum formicicum]
MTVLDNVPSRRRLSSLRRAFHRYPEPGWREFYTTVRIVDELESIGVDEIAVGPAALDTAKRLGVPDTEELDEWFQEAKDRYDGQSDVFDAIEGGHTGAVAVLDRGDGPTVGLRVDIDALPVTESEDPAHVPAAEGFRSENEGYMHACGHDAHITFGLGTIETLQRSDFEGTLKVFFQPAEELLGGGKAMANGPHIEDVDYMIGTHVGLGQPTGGVVAGARGALALNRMQFEFSGTQAHAGLAPNQGDNALQAFLTAAENLYGIPRHREGVTRVNVGQVRSENGTNVIADRVQAQVEVRGETTELMGYMRDSVERILESAAEMHECSVEYTTIGESIRHDSDPELVELVTGVADDVDGVSEVVPWMEMGSSEDVTYLLKAVSDTGGYSTLIGIGTSHPGDYHTPTFDVIEDSLPIGVGILSTVARRLFEDPLSVD